MRRGFTLVEVLVALAILEIGLVGAAGTLLAARRALTAAERLHRATQTAADVVDSLLAVGGSGSGQRDGEWGRVRWSAAGEGLDLLAETPAGAPLFVWWIPTGGGPP